MEHSHHFGISSGQRTHAGQNLAMVVSAEQTIDQVLEPGEVVRLEIGGKLESLVACATVDGVPDGQCQLLVDTAHDFDLQRGPLQWYRSGHLLPDEFAEVDEVAVENSSDEPTRVMVLVGYTPATVETEPDTEADD